MSAVDDFGRFSANPKLVRAALYPLRLDMYTDEDIIEHLKRCESAGLMRLYDVDTKPYLELSNFDQRTRAKRSKYPAPDGQMDAIGQPNGWHVAVKCPPRDSRPRPDTETDTETDTDTETESGACFDYEIHFEELWNAYPQKGRVKRPLSSHEYIEQVSPDPERIHGEIMAAVKGKWARSEKWVKGFIMAMPEWIRQQCWQEDPEPDQETRQDIPSYVPERVKVDGNWVTNPKWLEQQRKANESSNRAA